MTKRLMIGGTAALAMTGFAAPALSAAGANPRDLKRNSGNDDITSGVTNGFTDGGGSGQMMTHLDNVSGAIDRGQGHVTSAAWAIDCGQGDGGTDCITT